MRNFHLTHQPPAADLEGKRIEIQGTVQGVGFRPWVYRLAHDLCISGRVRNHAAGVTIDAFGTPEAMRAFIDRLSSSSAPAAVLIEHLHADAIPVEDVNGFEIVESDARGAPRVTIPPDLPTCPECLAELGGRSDRRRGYAFTNCTNCGPRFTIATAAPYDRPNTTMAGFGMCAACRREYESSGDRRFHAQPNACPHCGPSLSATDETGARIETQDVIGVAAQVIARGSIVAVKGIGGFHLACDATSAAAVERLRVRKRRDEKPFAVMVRDLDDARTIAVLTAEEERLMSSPERPIVLVPRREPCALTPSIAPRNPLVGLFLPYSPLHHLLLERAARPLVMTSGNVSDEPIAYTNEEALARLRGVADLIVTHNREIVTRCDDSVARVIAGRPVVLRRSRGYVPRTIALPRGIAHPVLACGAMLKNTFCLAWGEEACLGPHIGDLENLETYGSYRESIARLERFLHFEPEIIAHDLHPDYLSTRYALARRGAVAIGVQHHHAHIASVMAEHGIDGPVIGVAYDGTGLGTDGASWGGEVLVADYDRFERLATFRPIPLAGGDTAVRQPWRTALALVDDAFHGDAPLDSLALFRELPQADIDVVRRMIREHLHTPVAHGVGRYFDALGALALVRPRATYEGQLALEWNVIADPEERGRYRYEICRSAQPWQLDLRQTVRDCMFELIGGEPPARISARFHNTLAAATADLVRGVARTYGKRPVALSGGCFQNPRLAESVLRELTPEFTVHTHQRVPPGDGGLALGQAVVADAMARKF